MATVKYISHEKLPQWLAALAAERRLLVPVASGDGSVVFRPFDPARQPVLDGDATAPPKAAIFPACQELFRYEQTKDPENPEHTTMLSFSRPHTLAFSLVSLNEVVTDTLSILRGHLDERASEGLTLTVNLAESLPLVPGDGAQLKQVLLNLLTNSMCPECRYPLCGFGKS